MCRNFLAQSSKNSHGVSTLRKIKIRCPRTRTSPVRGYPELIFDLVLGAQMFYVYFLKSISYQDRFYVGYSIDLKNRVKRHNDKLVRSTKTYAPWELIFYEAYKSRFDAKRREKYLKTTKGRKVLHLMLRFSLDKLESRL